MCFCPCDKWIQTMFWEVWLLHHNSLHSSWRFHRTTGWLADFRCQSGIIQRDTSRGASWTPLSHRKPGESRRSFLSMDEIWLPCATRYGENTKKNRTGNTPVKVTNVTWLAWEPPSLRRGGWSPTAHGVWSGAGKKIRGQRNSCCGDLF